MEDKDLEKELKTSVDNMEVRDFSLIWNDIKGRVAPKKHTSKYHFTGWVASVAVLVCLIVVGSIVLPNVINLNKEIDIDILELTTEKIEPVAEPLNEQGIVADN